MKIINFKKVKQLRTDFPVTILKNCINRKYCKLIINEINNFNKFDDKVMVSRNRINKGSNNFQIFLKNSKFSRKLYSELNNYKTFLKIKNLLNLKNSDWIIRNKIDFFSKKSFGEQKTTILSLLKKFYYNSSFTRSELNLDLDFSIAEKGYYRGIHRDRDNRIVNFLIYFNNIPKKFGGSLNIYKSLKNHEENKFERFPKKKEVKLENKIFPKYGNMIIFLSSPNSYHEAAKFLSIKEKRYFVYGSYCLNKTVKWKKIK